MEEKQIKRIFHAEDLPDVLTMAHVAMFLGCSVSKAYGLLKLEGFPHTVLLHRVYVDKKKFLAWIDEQKGEAMAKAVSGSVSMEGGRAATSLGITS